MIEYSKRLEDRIKKRVNMGLSYLDTLRSLYGADPREVWDVLQTLNIPIESLSKININNSYPDLPEPHPAYSQWFLTKSSSKKILEKIAGMNYKNLSFLGCPVLGSHLETTIPTLFLDIDSTMLDKTSGKSCIPYDVHQEIPLEWLHSFDCVVCDPPWYAEDIKLFIKRASQLTKNDGTIYISIPGIMTRPSVLDERLEFQQWLSNSKLVIAEIYPNAEYEVPPFEFMAYQDIPLFTGEPWRIGDWVKRLLMIYFYLFLPLNLGGMNMVIIVKGYFCEINLLMVKSLPLEL